MCSLYTRTGDDGTTSLSDGSRVPKDSARVEVFGTIDEANCHIGLARVDIVDSDLDAVLAFIQQRLFNCSACMASETPAPETPRVSAEDVEWIESAIDRFSERVGKMNGFIIPGCDESSARLQVARAVVRRAERRTVTLTWHEPVDPQVLIFLNRVSDLLYLAARYASSGPECAWDAAAEAPNHR